MARQRLVPVDLHYLLSFYGNEKKLEPQRLLGVALAALEANARLDPALIKVVRTTEANEHLRRGKEELSEDSFLDAQLRSNIHRVTLTPLALNLEELSKLWSVFFQVPYALSIAYEASVVLIDAGSPVSPPLVRHEPQIGTVMGEPETWEQEKAAERDRLDKEGEAKEEARKAKEAAEKRKAEGETPLPSGGAGGTPPKRPARGQDKP